MKTAILSQCCALYDVTHYTLRPRDWLRLNLKVIPRFFRYFVRRALSHPRVVTIAGVLIPVPESYPWNVRLNLWSGGYEAPERAIVTRAIKDTDTVLEIGAGIGYISTLCARLIGSERVNTIEANPAMEPVIRQTHALNGVSPEFRSAYVGRGEGTQEFFVSESFFSSSESRREESGNPIQVEIVDLGHLIDELSPTFLIVDIEGAEKSLFHDVDLDCVRKICIEMHPHILGRAASSQVIVDILTRGFSLDIDGSHGRVLFFSREDGCGADAPK